MSCTVSSFAIHTLGPYSQPHKTHGVHTASPHKAHGVHTATLTRHTGCIQQGPQDTRGAYSHPHRSVQPSSQDAYIFFHDHFGASHAIRARCSKFAPRIYFAITRFAPWLCGASLKLLALTTHSRMTKWLGWIKSLPDAKWWQPFSQDAGDMAFQEKPQLFTSHFNLEWDVVHDKYNFWRSMNANGQEVKVYQHCGGLHTIFVRHAPSLRVYLSTSQPSGSEKLRT